MFTKGLTQFIVKTSYSDLPAEVVTAARQAILDHIGVAMAGSQDPSGKIISELVKENGSIPEATVIGQRYKASCSLAALANGSAAHVLDYDDCLDFPNAGLAHPTTGIMPALLAVGDKYHLSGKDLITAYCLGVEVYAKLGLLCRENWVGMRGWEWTSVLGVMAAAAAVSKALKLDEHQTEMTLGIAASMSSGLIRNFGSMAGHLHGGIAARSGIEAAFLARKGYTGRLGIIEIRGGFYNSFSGTSEAITPEAMQAQLKTLGNPWNIVNPGLMFKSYPCSHIVHFAVDAGLTFKRKYSVDWRQVAEVELHIPPMMSDTTTRPEPQIGVEGRFSTAYCFTRALMNGRLKIADFTDEAVRDPLTRPLMHKIKFVIKEQNRSNGVFGFLEAVLKTNDGKTYSCKIEHARGEPQNPQSPEEFEAKYLDCAETAHYDVKTATRIKDMIMDLTGVEDIAQITSLMG